MTTNATAIRSTCCRLASYDSYKLQKLQISPFYFLCICLNWRDCFSCNWKMNWVLYQYRKFQAQNNSDNWYTTPTDKTVIEYIHIYIFRRVATFFLGGGESKLLEKGTLFFSPIHSPSIFSWRKNHSGYHDDILGCWGISMYMYWEYI